MKNFLPFLLISGAVTGLADDASSSTSTIRHENFALPHYRVYAVEPSAEDAKRPILQLLKQDLKDAPPIAMGGIFSPESIAGHADLWRPMEASLKEIPAAEVPIRIDTTPSPDGQALDLRIRPVNALASKGDIDVSILRGSSILLTVSDASRPTGRRGLLVRQE